MTKQMPKKKLVKKLEPPLNVVATRWSGGWELEIARDMHYTQVNHLSHAQQQVLDYLDTLWPEDEAEHATWEINIIPDVASASASLAQARESAAKAEAARREAAQATRAAVKELIDEGVAQVDIAFLMGVSRARVSQLARA